MPPKVRAEKVYEDYLESLASNHKFRIGFLLGAENVGGFQGIIIHMAPMSISETEEHNPQSILSVDSDEIVLEAVNLTRMLPGGFSILGLFIVYPDNPLENDKQKKKLLDMVKKVQEQFRMNPFLMASLSEEKDFLVLVYSSGRENPCVCQQIHTGKPVDVVFESQKLKWYDVETYYNVCNEYALEKIGDSCNIEGNMQKILGKFKQKLEQSEAFVHDNPIKDQQTVELLFKDPKSTELQVQLNPLQFFESEESQFEDTAEEICDGTLRLSGSMCSRVFVPKGTKLTEVAKNAKKDILRSLAARFQLYCDTLQGDQVAPDTLIDLHSDTPRRVFFTVQPTAVQFCDYLFAGENDDTVRENVSKSMDINLEPTDIFLLAEAAPEAQDAENLQDEEKKSSPTQDTVDRPEIYLKILAGVSLLVALVAAFMALQQDQEKE
ncbi:protein odr-4 homolog [Phlebotomus argentipes]|uniref:protein odr-4 homolog n=1 Tax=Phlebotomus argentipes TaxID=94469 RepID=UPI0028936240|nr:protein odr-4 homolog [Phlebotomus argentipes]